DLVQRGVSRRNRPVHVINVDIKDTPDEIIEELDVRAGLGLDEEGDECSAEDEAKLKSEAEQILMEDEGYRNLMKGIKK
ncbi:MAG: hypothetical protein EBV23_13015, partial [Flavobacteriia bacterium]|nr:hypothetical protein [Flavobacteriia bacterium]